MSLTSSRRSVSTPRPGVSKSSRVIERPNFTSTRT
jgi:hypothetical protein